MMKGSTCTTRLVITGLSEPVFSLIIAFPSAVLCWSPYSIRLKVQSPLPCLMWANDRIRHLGRLTSFRCRPARRISGVSAPSHRSRPLRQPCPSYADAGGRNIQTSSFIKSEAKLVLGVERRRMKRAIYRCNRVRDFIVVLPHHRSSDRDRDGVGLEHEVFDGGASFGRQGGRRIDDTTHHRSRRECAQAVTQQGHERVLLMRRRRLTLRRPGWHPRPGRR